ncbi:hypothetical protein SAMN05216338_100598 [Bradyrhizobium sp. Rc2d]|nr:hypothetical protein SAMN05216338_100598 [Bradyrhizobium sp. Rc2d]
MARLVRSGHAVSLPAKGLVPLLWLKSSFAGEPQASSMIDTANWTVVRNVSGVGLEEGREF